MDNDHSSGSAHESETEMQRELSEDETEIWDSDIDSCSESDGLFSYFLNV